MPKLPLSKAKKEVEDAEWDDLRISIELDLEKAMQTIDRVSMNIEERCGQIKACCESIIEEIDMSSFS